MVVRAMMVGTMIVVVIMAVSVVFFVAMTVQMLLIWLRCYCSHFR